LELAPLLLLAASAALALALAPRPCGADTTLRVLSSGGGDFASVQAALDSAAPRAGSPALGRLTLRLGGAFRERVVVAANLSGGVDFVPDDGAASAPRPLIAFNVSGAGGAGCSGAGGPGTFGSYTMTILGDDVRMRGVDVANDACGYDHKAAGQSVALDVRGDRAAFFGVRLLGAQDTLYTGKGRVYFADSFVNGSCDAIFGDGAAVFERATIRMDFTVTAQRGNGSTAYLFLNSSVDALAGGPASLVLGRPWGPLARTVFSGCALGAGVAPEGWSDWSHNCSAAPDSWCNATFYAEYNNSGPGWAPGRRVPWAHVLGDAEGAAWTVASVLGDWTPSPPP